MHPLFPHAIKIKHIEEVHESQDQQDHSKLGGDVLYTFLQCCWWRAEPEEDQYETDVNEIKPNHQQVVYRVGHLFLIFESIQKKDAPVFVERASDPDGHGDTDDRVEDVDVNGCCHGVLSLVVLINCAITVGNGLVNECGR